MVWNIYTHIYISVTLWSVQSKKKKKENNFLLLHHVSRCPVAQPISPSLKRSLNSHQVSLLAAFDSRRWSFAQVLIGANPVMLVRLGSWLPVLSTVASFHPHASARCLTANTSTSWSGAVWVVAKRWMSFSSSLSLFADWNLSPPLPSIFN